MRDPAISTGLRRVDTFRRPGVLYLKDVDLDVLDLSVRLAPRRIFSMPSRGWAKSGIAVDSRSGAAYVHDGDEVWRVESSEGPRRVLHASEIVSTAPVSPARVILGGPFEVCEEKGTLYSGAWLAYEGVKCLSTDVVGKISLGTRWMQQVDVDDYGNPSIDAVREIVASLGLGLTVSSFLNSKRRRFAGTDAFHHCELDIAASRVLLSGYSLFPGDVALANLATRQVERLSVQGTFACWGRSEGVFVVAEEGRLLEHDLPTGITRELMVVEWTTRLPGLSRGMGACPVVSRDRTWLAWRTSSRMEETPEGMTIVVDLLNDEYAVLPTQWRAMRFSS